MSEDRHALLSHDGGARALASPSQQPGKMKKWMILLWMDGKTHMTCEVMCNLGCPTPH